MQEQTPEQKLELEKQMAQAGISSIYNEDDKPAVVKYIKDYIKRNGYINTRYATRQSVKWKTPETSFTDAQHADAFYESVSAMLVNTGKYTRERNRIEAKGYNVLKNPAYYNSRSVIIIAGLSFIISLFTFIRGALTDTKPQYTQEQINLERQRLEIDKETQSNVLQSLKMINQRIQQIDSSKMK